MIAVSCPAKTLITVSSLRHKVCKRRTVLSD